MMNTILDIPVYTGLLKATFAQIYLCCLNLALNNMPSKMMQYLR